MPRLNDAQEASRIYLHALVQRALTETGKTRNQMADEIGPPISSAMMALHLKGDRPIQLAAAIRYAQYFGSPIEPLLGDQLQTVRKAARMISEASEQAPPHVAESPAPYRTDPRVRRLCDQINSLEADSLDEIERQVDRAVRFDELRRSVRTMTR